MGEGRAGSQCPLGSSWRLGLGSSPGEWSMPEEVSSPGKEAKEGAWTPRAASRPHERSRKARRSVGKELQAGDRRPRPSVEACLPSAADAVTPLDSRLVRQCALGARAPRDFGASSLGMEVGGQHCRWGFLIHGVSSFLILLAHRLTPFLCFSMLWVLEPEFACLLERGVSRRRNSVPDTL